MDQAMDGGVNFFDAAEMYPVPPKPETQGATEAILGTWMKARGNRDKVIVVTKATGPGADFAYSGGTSAHIKANLEAAVDGSLKRLQTITSTCTISIGQTGGQQFRPHVVRPFESPDRHAAEETLAALADLVKARCAQSACPMTHLGVSTHFSKRRAILICRGSSQSRIRTICWRGTSNSVSPRWLCAGRPIGLFTARARGAFRQIYERKSPWWRTIHYSRSL